MSIAPTVQPSLPEALRQIVRWWRGSRPTKREQQVEDVVVARIAVELAEVEALLGNQAVDSSPEPPTEKPKLRRKQAAT